MKNEQLLFEELKSVLSAYVALSSPTDETACKIIDHALCVLKQSSVEEHDEKN